MPWWARWGISLLVAFALISLGWRYVPLLITLHVMVCFVLIIVIMLQSGNAADLAGAFGGAGSQTAFGPRGAATFLSHATTWCAIVFMVTSLALSIKRTPEDVGTGSLLEQTQKAGTAPAKPPTPVPIPIPGQAPAQIPVAPTPAPSSSQPGQAPGQTPAQKAPSQQTPPPQK